jgi:hypothetical protein
MSFGKGAKFRNTLLENCTYFPTLKDSLEITNYAHDLLKKGTKTDFLWALGLWETQNVTFGGLKSDFYRLGNDLRIDPVSNASSSFKCYWGIQLKGLSGDAGTAEISSFGARDQFSVMISPSETNRPVGNPTIFTTLGIRRCSYQAAGNLTEWTDSSLNILSKVELDGAITCPKITIGTSDRLNELVGLTADQTKVIGFDAAGKLAVTDKETSSGTALDAPVAIAVTATNTLAALPKAPSAAGRIILYVDGVAEFSTGSSPSYTVSGTAIIWSAANAKYSLAIDMKVFALIW